MEASIADCTFSLGELIQLMDNGIAKKRRRESDMLVTGAVMIPPNEITEKGKRLYQERFQKEYEAASPGKYLAIDVTSEQAFVADAPETALEMAQKANPNGFFYLVRIGAQGVVRVGYIQRHANQWQL